VGVTAAAHEDPARPGLQVQDRHLCDIEVAQLGRHDREQHGPATRQQLRPEMIGFALRAVGLFPFELLRRHVLEGAQNRPVRGETLLSRKR